MASDFFKRAALVADTSAGGQGKLQPQENPVTQSILHAVGKRQHVLCALPLYNHAPSLYALAAMMSPGTAVVVCPEHQVILRHLEFFARNSFAYPEVCYLSEQQAPHDMRDVAEQVRQGRVKLLFTTPEIFDTLNFIDLVVHTPISFLAVEQAERLYSPLQGRFRYDRLKEALARYRRKPPMLLLTHPLPDGIAQSLLTQLELKDVACISHPPSSQSVHIQTHLLHTTHQKQKKLIQLLLQPGDLKEPLTEQALLGRLFNPGAAIIRLSEEKIARRLEQVLLRYGFHQVHCWLPSMKLDEKRTLERRFADEDNLIVLAVGEGHRYLKAAPQTQLKIIDWHCPLSLENLFASWFRRDQKQDELYESSLYAHLLYTKEDFEDLYRRTNPIYTHAHYPPEVKDSLKRLRHWVLSWQCRRQSMMMHWDFELGAALTPCGYCDRCQIRQKTLFTYLEPFYPLWEAWRFK